MTVNRATRREIALVVRAVRAEQPSSARGATYRRYLLLSLDEFDRALVWEYREVRAATQGRFVLARRADRRATRLFEASVAHERRAVKAIRQVVPDTAADDRPSQGHGGVAGSGAGWAGIRAIQDGMAREAGV